MTTENIMYYIYLFLTVYGILLMIMFILPFLVSYIVSKTLGLLEQTMLKNMTENQESLMMSPGIIIHELSHLITALIFGHKITSFNLFHLPDQDGGRGYVNHSYNNSLYQKLGNCYIAIAPAITLTTLNLLDLYYLYNSIFINHHFSWWIVFGIVFIATTINGAIISSADWDGFKSGIVSFIVTTFLLAIIITIVLLILNQFIDFDLFEQIRIFLNM